LPFPFSVFSRASLFAPAKRRFALQGASVIFRQKIKGIVLGY
jgi:hypothetical protein